MDLVEKCLTLDLNVPILNLINEACAKCVEDPMAFSKAQHREKWKPLEGLWLGLSFSLSLNTQEAKM